MHKRRAKSAGFHHLLWLAQAHQPASRTSGQHRLPFLPPAIQYRCHARPRLVHAILHPILPLSSSKPFVKCTTCQTCFDVDIEQFRRKAAMPDERSWQECIAVYNTLRESPKDSPAAQSIAGDVRRNARV